MNMSINKFYKVLLTLVLLVSAGPSLFAQGLQSYVNDSYDGKLTVTIEGVSYVHENVRMYVEKSSDGSVKLMLRDFRLRRDGEVTPVGTVVIPGIQLVSTDSRSLVGFSFTKKITIADKDVNTDPDGENSASGGDQDGGEGFGNNDGIDSGGGETEWLGPTYGELSVNSRGSLSMMQADISFEVLIPSLDKKAYVTFRTNNVTTLVPAVKVTGGARKGYTPAGIPVSSAYRGIVVLTTR